MVGDLDAAEPLDRGDADPARDDQADGEAVVRGERLAVHLVGDEHVVECLADRQRPTHVTLVDTAADDDGIEALGQHVDGVAPQPGPPQQQRQWDAAPAGRTDCAEAPLRAARRLALLGAEEAASVAGALDEGGRGPRRQPPELAVAQVERTANTAAVHPQPPGAGVDQGSGGVVADEEALVRSDQPLGRDGVPARLGVRAVDDEPLGRQGLDDGGWRLGRGGRKGGRGRASTRTHRAGERGRPEPGAQRGRPTIRVSARRRVSPGGEPAVSSGGRSSHGSMAMADDRSR